MRLKGSGIRRLSHVCDAAYIGGINQTVPFLQDHTNAKGDRVPGLFNHLTTVGNFDHDTRHRRFATYINISAMGGTFEATWNRVRGGVDIGDDDANAEGVLGQAAVAAGLDDRGRVIEKLQKEVTKQREDFAHEQLAAAMAALPRGDAVRLAFQQWDLYGSQFIDALPNKRHLLCARDWREAWFHFLGVPNPAYAHHVGRQIVAGKPTRFDFSIVNNA